MAANKAELWSQLTKAIDIMDTTYKYFSGDASTTPNMLADIKTLETDFKGNHISDTASQIKSFRNSASSMIQQGASLTTPILKELGRIGYYSINNNISLILDDIYQGMKDASETVRYRNFTFGAVSDAGVAVGNGTVYRLLKNKDNYDIEVGAVNAGITKIKCTEDRYSGRSEGNETFIMYGSGLTNVDNVELGTAPTGTATIFALTSQDCTSYLTDGSFDTTDDTGTITISGWSLDTPANFLKETTTTYRNTRGSSTGVSIEITANSYMTQNIADEGHTFNSSKPTMMVVRYYRKASCDGNLKITLGNETVTLDLTTVANATWLDLTLGTGTDDGGWYQQWGKDDATIKIELESNTTGTLLVDEVLITQPTFYDGKYYLLTAGTTDYLKGDYFTFTDSVLNTGRIQYFINKMFGKMLPHATTGETYPDA